MTQKYLYRLPLPSSAQVSTRKQIRRNLAANGVLNESSPTLESISLQPGEKLLRGGYRGTYAREMAAEVEELADAASIADVPVYGQTTATLDDGYYTLADATVRPVRPQSDALAAFDVTLRKKGTRASHRRAVRTNPVQVTNDFGNDATAEIGIPTAATKVQWFNSETKETESPSLVTTRTSEGGDVAIYDVQSSTFSKPVLIYDLPYTDQGPTDVIIWDTHGREKTDTNGVVCWSRTFVSDHHFTGNAVFDNGLLRLTFDESASSITVEEWNSGSSSWSALALGTSDWQLFDLDIARVGVERVEAQITFEDTTDGSTYPLDMRFARGMKMVQWTIPENVSGPVPAGIQDLLAPIASNSIIAPGESQGLVRRKEVRA